VANGWRVRLRAGLCDQISSPVLGVERDHTERRVPGGRIEHGPLIMIGVPSSLYFRIGARN